MLKHKIRTTLLKGKTRTKIRMIVDFSDPGYELLSIFLEDDYLQFGDKIREELYAVYDGDKPSSEFRGNRIHAAFAGNLCLLYDTVAEDGLGEWCQIGLDDLLDLMDEVDDKMDELREQAQEEKKEAE